MTWSEVVYGVLFQPVDTLRYLADEKPVGRGLLTFLLVTVTNLILLRGVEGTGPGPLSSLFREFFPLYATLGTFFAFFCSAPDSRIPVPAGRIIVSAGKCQRASDLSGPGHYTWFGRVHPAICPGSAGSGSVGWGGFPCHLCMGNSAASTIPAGVTGPDYGAGGADLYSASSQLFAGGIDSGICHGREFPAGNLKTCSRTLPTGVVVIIKQTPGRWVAN